MSNVSKGVIFLGTIASISSLLSHAYPEIILVIINILSFLLLGILMVYSLFGIFYGRLQSETWLSTNIVGALFLLIALWACPFVGKGIADWEFSRKINEYTAIVEKVKSGSISCVSPCGDQLKHLEGSDKIMKNRVVLAKLCDGGGLVVLFLFQTDVIMLHDGYFFKQPVDGNKCVDDAIKPQRRFPYIRHVSGNWFHFSDQPGL